jgi:hypothetical protein
MHERISYCKHRFSLASELLDIARGLKTGPGYKQLFYQRSRVFTLLGYTIHGFAPISSTPDLAKNYCPAYIHFIQLQEEFFWWRATLRALSCERVFDVSCMLVRLSISLLYTRVIQAEWGEEMVRHCHSEIVRICAQLEIVFVNRK